MLIISSFEISELLSLCKPVQQYFLNWWWCS